MNKYTTRCLISNVYKSQVQVLFHSPDIIFMLGLNENLNCHTFINVVLWFIREKNNNNWEKYTLSVFFCMRVMQIFQTQ